MNHHIAAEYEVSFADYDLYHGSNGGYFGHNFKVGGFSKFMMDTNVKMYWVAFFSLLAYWGLLWFIRHIFWDGHPQTTNNSTLTRPNGRASGRHDDNVQPSTSSGYRRWIQRPGTSSVYDSLTRASQILGDLVLMLLSVLILSTFSQGEARTTMVLTWVFFGFAVFWSMFEIAKDSHVARFLFGMIFYGIALAIGTLSFIHGFRGIYD